MHQNTSFTHKKNPKILWGGGCALPQTLFSVESGHPSPCPILQVLPLQLSLDPGYATDPECHFRENVCCMGTNWVSYQLTKQAHNDDDGKL